MTKYWSAFERDQLFGAMHDAYKCRWTGHLVANPEYDSKEMYKAVSWAVHSAENTGTPSVTVFVLPAWTEGSNTAYMKWVRKMPHTCKLMATIPRRSFKFIQQPQATTVGLPPEDTGHPKWDINILLVANNRGFETLTNGDAAGMAKQLKQKLIQAVNEHAHPSELLTWARLGHHWPDGPSEESSPGDESENEEEMDTTIYRPPAKVLASPSDAGTAALTLNNSLAHLLQTASEQLQLNQLLPLKYDWRSMVYTDGSQRKTDIGPNGRQTVQLGSGIYVPA